MNEEIEFSREHGGGAGRGAACVFTLQQQEKALQAGVALRRGRVVHAPDGEFGTSIGAYHAAACSAGLLPELEQAYRSIRRKRDVMRLDLNPFDGDGIGWDLDEFDELVARYGIGEGMKRPTWVGVVHIPTWDAPNVETLTRPGHRLVRIDNLDAKTARIWMRRSATQQPFHKPADPDGDDWMDGGASAVLPPSDDVCPNLSEVWSVACSPLTYAQRTIQAPRRGRGPWRVPVAALEILVDTNVQLDRLRLTRLAARGVAVRGWWPPTLDEVREPFDLSRDTTVHRLDVVGPRVWKNRHTFTANGPRRDR